MTKDQRRIYDSIKCKFRPDVMDNPGFAGLVEVYAKMLAEENDLQEFVDQNGTSYQSTNRDNITLWKSYPQYQQLQRLRGQLTSVLRTLMKYAHEGEVEEGEDDKLLA